MQIVVSLGALLLLFWALEVIGNFLRLLPWMLGGGLAIGLIYLAIKLLTKIGCTSSPKATSLVSHLPYVREALPLRPLESRKAAAPIRRRVLKDGNLRRRTSRKAAEWRNKKRLGGSSSVAKPQGGETMTTRGLVIAEEPLNRILSGKKTMELRAKHNRRLGPIALIMKKSKKVFGVARIVESIGPMDFKEFTARAGEHCVEKQRLREVFDQGWIYGWRFAGIKRLRHPVSYIHKGMSQVILDPRAVAEIAAQLRVR